MAYDFQVAVDCARPHELADWWAEALGWTVEEPDEAFIRKMIAEGYAAEDETTTHHGKLVWRTGAAISNPDGPQGARRQRLLFQQVPEAKTAKNRWHLDVNVGAGNVRAETDRLVASGAVFLHNGQQGPHTWVTMADPEGNEFCIR
jgi:Glyoxalase-like domain